MNYGYQVLIISEPATDLKRRKDITSDISNIDFAKMIIEYQLKREDEAEDFAKNCSAQVIVICDRSIVDPAVYIDMESYKEILKEFNISFDEALNRYNLVVHLETAAKGAEEFYTLENNDIRNESIQEAIALDDKLLEVWSKHKNRHIITNERKDFKEKLERIKKVVGDHVESEKKLEIY